MPYCIWNTQTNQIVQGPWESIPKRVFWASGDTVSPGQLGQSNGGERIVSIEITKDIPKYHKKTGWQDTFDGNTVTRVAISERVHWPDESDVEDEFERRLGKLNITTRKQFEAFQDYLLLKELKDEGGRFTQAQQTRWDQLRQDWQVLRNLRTKAEVIKAMQPIPDDYDEDSRWA